MPKDYPAASSGVFNLKNIRKSFALNILLYKTSGFFQHPFTVSGIFQLRKQLQETISYKTKTAKRHIAIHLPAVFCLLSRNSEAAVRHSSPGNSHNSHRVWLYLTLISGLILYQRGCRIYSSPPICLIALIAKVSVRPHAIPAIRHG